MPDFMKKYEELEKCFETQVDLDRKKPGCKDIVYLPIFPRPKDKVDYIFIAMEPSLRNDWAGNPPNRKDADVAIKKGARNFMPGRMEGCILHYCIKEYLCREGQPYYITDMSKGAMPVKGADRGREERWGEWSPLLAKELELVAKKDATIFTIGQKVHNFLTDNRTGNAQIQEKFAGRIEYLLHYSGRAAGHRKKCIDGREDEFGKLNVTEEKLANIIRPMLEEEGTKWADDSAELIKGIKLTESWKMLIFCYKIKFEACRGKIH